MNELALFAGAGGGILASHMLGIRTICGVEISGYSAQVLAQRQNDGCIEPFPIWSDVRTFDAERWRGTVDIVSGGFPCQDISSAGRGAGISGEKSGLWSDMARIIDESGAAFAFVENSSLLRNRGLNVVLQDFANMGFNAEWGVVPASYFGAPHSRKRMWIFASNPERCTERQESRCREIGRMGGQLKSISWNRTWAHQESSLRRMVNGLARPVDRTDAIRNGQVPIVAARTLAHFMSRL